jgi:hypothetical protein
VSDVLERLRMKETKGTATLEELAAADEMEHLRACLAEIRIYADQGIGKGITKSAILRAVEAGLHETS